MHRLAGVLPWSGVPTNGQRSGRRGMSAHLRSGRREHLSGWHHLQSLRRQLGILLLRLKP